MDEDKEVVVTGDGSRTLFHSQFKEHYHSSAGALSEAYKKYLDPFVRKAPPTKEVFFLDPFLGLGYNAFAFLEHFHSRGIPVRGVAVEIDASLRPYWDETLGCFPTLWREFGSFEALIRHNKIEALYLEDLWKVLPLLKEEVKKKGRRFDVILHDAFSFYKCPELWCVELFRHYNELLNEGGMVITYSSSKIVRAGLMEAGFWVQEVEKALDRASTLAFKDPKQLSDGKILEIFKGRGVPYRQVKAPSLEEQRLRMIENQRKESSIH